jgi:carboxyl-terminal processing protease
MLRSRIFVAVMIVVGLSWAAELPADGTLSLGERVFIASKIYSLIPTFFAHWKGTSDLDLDAAYRAYLNKILSSNDRRQFDLATMEFVAKLRNGHTGFWDPWFIDHYGQPRFFDAKYLSGQWTITHSSISGLNPGDVLVSIDDQPLDQFFAERRQYLSGSSESQLRRRLFSSSNTPFPQKFSITLADGRHIQAERKLPEPEPKKDPVATEGRWIREGTLAYIKIPSFDDPAFQESAIEFVKKFKAAMALIIDVRGNEGGGTPSELIRSLMDRPWRHWIETTPVSDALRKMDMGNDPGFHLDYTYEFRAEKPEAVYSGQLFILTDGDCTSACEDFVMPFKDNERAKIVGGTTFGSSGQPYFYRFENGMIFGISAKREYFPDGSEFEGMGIKPDVEVEPKPADLRSGNDVILQRAVDLAQRH